MGSLVASVLLKYGWGWSMVVPGLIISLVGLVLFLLLPVSPESIGVSGDDDKLMAPKKIGEGVTEPLLRSETHNQDKAWKIPGVASFCQIGCLYIFVLASILH